MTQGTTSEVHPARAEPSILLVDDDVELCELLRSSSRSAASAWKWRTTGREAVAQLAGDHDLILLDVMMPGARRLRGAPPGAATEPGPGDHAHGPDHAGGPGRRAGRRRRRLPAQAVRDGRAAGPDPGRAPPGRPAPKEAEVLEAGGVRLIPSAREVLGRGLACRLTTVEYDILEFLVHAAGRIVSRDELTAALYRRRATQFDRTLDMHICNLRKKLGRNGDLIRTVRGVGYLFRIGPGRPGERPDMRSIFAKVLLWSLGTFAPLAGRLLGHLGRFS